MSVQSIFDGQCPWTTDFDLSGELTGYNGSDYRVLFNAIAEKCYVKTLNLSRNNIDDERCSVIAEYLNNSSHIQSLNLSDNRISQIGWVKFAKALSANSLVKTL